MISVIGGSYRENVIRPGSRRFLGSGLRAAIVLSGAHMGELVTCWSPADRDDGEATAGIHHVSVRPIDRDRPIGFDYVSPVADPIATGADAVVVANADVTLRADTVLRFGMVEGLLPIDVAAGTLVVDPQGDASLPTAGRCERLAVVANAHEVARLAGDGPLRESAARLRADTGADVVVVKCGARGALVVTEAGTEEVGAHPTERVRPLGSGDIFSAAFALAYGERGANPVEAARFASRAAAWWCGSRSEGPLPASFEELPTLPFAEAPRVYLAGPFFTLAEAWLVDMVRSALVDLGAAPFSPMHDVGPGGPEVAERDLRGLDGCASVLALLDGLDPGTMFELGHARLADVPVVGYVDPDPGHGLVMPAGTGVEIHDDLSTAAYRSVWRAMGLR